MAVAVEFIADITGLRGPAGSIHKGSLPTNANVNNYYEPEHEGSWTFSGSTGLTIVNLPDGVTAGQIFVLPGLGGQIVTSYSGTEPVFWFRGRTTTTGGFGKWMNLNSTRSIKDPELILAGTNLNFWWVADRAGYWEVNSTTTAAEIINLPVAAPGKFINNPDQIATQIYMSYGLANSAPGFWYRALANVTTKAWSDWVNLAAGGSGGGSTDTEQYALKHAYRVDEGRKRFGYKIGAPCMIALQFDDYNGMFRDKVLPILREFDIPATMALAVNWVEGTVNHPLAENVPWSTVQSWVLSDGCSAQGHSWSHSAASTDGQLRKEIIESADYMESKMPSVAIDDWSMPGTGADVPYGGYYGKSIEDFTATTAGKMLLSRYAFVFGARGGSYQPGGGTDLIGQSHGMAEVYTVQEFKDGIELAIAGGYAMATMHHPGFLDTAGYKTTAQLRQCIQWLAEQRDAGRLILTTRRALTGFDPSSTYRQNLLPGSFGGNLKGWSGWTLNGSGNPATSTTTPLAYTLDLLNVNWARGGTREFHAKVRAATTTVVRLTASGASLNATKDYTLPAGQWVDIRKFFTVPLVGQRTMTFSIQRVSGGSVEVQQIDALAA